MESHIINWTLKSINAPLDTFSPPVDMHKSISQIKALPPLPEIAHRIMQLASDPYSDAQKLAEIVELDPLLTAQVIRWASSPLYGYRGKIYSVQDAISRVLGYDYVLNLAMGLSAMSPLKTPKEGTVGAKEQWRQSLASSFLMSKLSQKILPENRPNPQQVQLAALLHNIGFFLLGHQFNDEFHYLDKLITANPALPVLRIENFAFGTDHTQLGTWLMHTWSMPKPIIDVVHHHHNPYYRGENHALNLLTYLSDALLGKIGLGDAINQDCPSIVFEQLHLSDTIGENLLDDLSDNLQAIDSTAETLAS